MSLLSRHGLEGSIRKKQVHLQGSIRKEADLHSTVRGHIGTARYRSARGKSEYTDGHTPGSYVKVCTPQLNKVRIWKRKSRRKRRAEAISKREDRAPASASWRPWQPVVYSNFYFSAV